MNQKQYNNEGVRLTDCCAAMSTYMDNGAGEYALCCKACYEEVPAGQGDGAEHKQMETVDDS